MLVKKIIETTTPLIESGQLIYNLPVLISTNAEKTFSVIPYSIVVSAACDIESCFRIEANIVKTESEFDRQVIFQLMMCPAFDEDLFMAGQHLESIYNCKTKAINAKEKEKYKKDTRLFYIENKNFANLPNLFIDYKHYFTLPIELVKEHLKDAKEKYILEHIQYTKLADLFAHYLQRVGIP